HESGLAGIREADHPHVGEELELEVYPPLLAGPAQVGTPRCAVGRVREAGIAAPAPRAAGDGQPLPGRGEVAEGVAPVAIGDDRPEGHAEHGVGPASPMLVGALAVLAALGGVVTLVVEVEERADGGIRLEDHTAAVAAVTAIGTTAGNELLAAEAHAAR